MSADESTPTAGETTWTRGSSMMDDVYGEGFSRRLPQTDQTPFLHDTVEHLFADIWSRPGLSVRDRRLLVIGATASLGRSDLIRIQTLGALRNGELDAEQLREAHLHLAYYVGWGNASAVGSGFDAALADYDDLTRKNTEKEEES
jgi:4-carboxymuconolactone decarboxylase